MSKKCLIVAIAASLLLCVPQVTVAQDAKTVISNAAKAMGAENLKTIQYSGTGFNSALGQSPNPNAAWPTFPIKTYSREIDLDAVISRVTLVRTQGPTIRGGGGQPIIGEQTQNQNITTNSGWNTQLDFWITPYGFLKGAAANNATVASRNMNGKRYNVVSFTMQNKYKVNGYLNDQNMVEKVETSLENPVLGDMPVEVTYAEYKDFSGLKFPTRMTQKQGGHPFTDLTITEVKPNATLTAPAAAQGGRGGAGAPPAPGQAPAIQTTQLAEGVHSVSGTHQSVIIDFKDHVVVVEGPGNEDRSKIVIGEVKKLYPNKPMRYLINTHHHFDHSGGIRTFAAEGATIITHQMNKPYYENNAKNPWALAPDSLATSKKPLKIETMTDKKVLTDGTRTVELHLIKGNPHNDGLIMVYLPKEKILIQADAFNPPAANATPPPAGTPPNPFTVNLIENIDRLKLDVDKVVGIHGPVSTKDALWKAGGK